MAMKDIESCLLAEVALPAQAVGSNATTAGSAINMSGYESVMFTPFSGARTDGTFTPAILEGDDNNISNASAVADDDLLPSGTGQEATAAIGAANTVSQIGYRGTKQYVFCSLVSTSVTTGGTVGVMAVKGHPAKAPTS